MKFRVFIVYVFFVCIVLPGISLAQNKVVVIPLWSESGDEIPTVSSAGGRVWMDRNLGAHRVAQSSDDYQGYGWLYQWGRLADGHEVRHSPTTITLSTDNVPGHSDFITSSTPPGDWITPQNDNLWQGVSGDNNPCPAGFRLPTETEWAREIATWTSEDAGGAIGSKLKLPLTGYRSISGMLTSVGQLGYYWTSDTDGTRSKSMEITVDAVSIVGGGFRGNGASVRCIRD